MFDVHEYMLSLREKDEAILAIADSINEVIRCLHRNAPGEELERAVAKMNAYREAYTALSEHSRRLIV